MPISRTNCSRLRVLIADPNDVHRTLTATLFASLDCDVEVAQGGIEAATYALAESFDVIMIERRPRTTGGDESISLIRWHLSHSKDALIVCHSIEPPTGEDADRYDAIACKPLSPQDALRLINLRRGAQLSVVKTSEPEYRRRA